VLTTPATDNIYMHKYCATAYFLGNYGTTKMLTGTMYQKKMVPDEIALLTYVKKSGIIMYN